MAMTRQRMLSKEKFAVSAKMLIQQKYSVSAKFDESAKIPADDSSKICQQKI